MKVLLKYVYISFFEKVYMKKKKKKKHKIVKT